MAIYSIIKRNFPVKGSKLIDFMSNQLGVCFWSEECYVYFHFGESCSSSIDQNSNQFKFCSAEESVIFVREIEKEFNIHVNFVNFEKIFNEIAKFNEGKEIKILDRPNDFAQILVDEYISNLEKWLYNQRKNK